MVKKKKEEAEGIGRTHLVDHQNCRGAVAKEVKKKWKTSASQDREPERAKKRMGSERGRTDH